jgi:ATP-dependent Clp protease ATP-binding subunit ClpX
VIGFGSKKDQEKKEPLEVKLLNKSELLRQVEPEDLIQYGMIPEFVGRFHSIANCNELTVDDLVSILTEPKNAVIKQFTEMFKAEGVKLNFTEDSLRSIAEKAIIAGTGARALRMILESMMRNLMFDAPSDDTIAEVTVEKECVTENVEPTIKRSNKAKKIA